MFAFVTIANAFAGGLTTANQPHLQTVSSSIQLCFQTWSLLNLHVHMKAGCMKSGQMCLQHESCRRMRASKEMAKDNNEEA